MRAAVAIAHKILMAVSHMLVNRSDYRELGAGYLDQLNHHRTANHLTRRLRNLGYDVQITPKAA
jgi:transposase